MLRKIFFRVLRLVLRSKIGYVFFNFMQDKWHCLEDVPTEEVRRNLNQIHPKPNSQMTWHLNKTYSPGLTVVIPFYNTEKYARRCIESVLSQRCDVPFEIILVDDGSPDKCGAILDSYRSDKRIRVVHQSNKGFSGARNTGIELAAKEYIMFVDSDDVLCPNAIHALISLAYEKNADIVEGGFQTFGGIKTPRTFAHDFAENSHGAGMFGYAWGKVMRTALFRDVCFPTNYWYEDTIIPAVIYPKAAVSITIPDIVVKYFNNPKGITRRSHANPKCIDTLYIVEDILEFYLQTQTELNTKVKKGNLYQLGGYLHHRTERLGSNAQKAVFLYAVEVVLQYQLLKLDCDLNRFEKELRDALMYRQYTRWIFASIAL